MKAMGFRGGNFTIPHKVAVIPLLDGLSQAAELMGAVNCVHNVEGKLMGENTDGKGGGAARAIAGELALSGAAHITIVNRNETRGQELAELLNQRAKVSARFFPWQGQYVVDEEAHIVINATSIGLGDAHARVPIDIASLLPDMVVADVIFNPPQTVFLREAAERGCRTLDGLGMLVNQAVIGFKIWTGEDADPNVMREALEEYLEL
jgi:shikimate dehydrogenase